MDIKRIPVTSLDHALKLWEDFHFNAKMSVLLATQGLLDLSSLGPTAHCDDFRQFLLEAREETEFDSVRFGTRKSHLDRLSKSNVKTATLVLNQHLQAQALYRWSRHSRRAFHLTDELVLLLRQTSLHNMTWGEVQWPFESYAITLNTPLRCGGWELDCLVVHPSGVPKGQDCWISCFDHRVRNWQGLSRGRRKMFMRDVGNKNWERVQQNAAADFEAMRTQNLHAMHLAVGSGDDKIVAAGKKFVDHLRSQGFESVSREEIEPIFRIVAGLSQYLKSLPSGTPHIERSDRISRTRDLDPKSIIAEADVATISSYYTLTPQERLVLEEHLLGPSGHQMCAHWRRGHWRRPVGMGDVPGAAKTVWVRPTLVRMDRLPEGTQPGGAMQVIELPEAKE